MQPMDKLMPIKDEDGYELWLRYRPVNAVARLMQYRATLQQVTLLGQSATTGLIRSELTRALPALLGSNCPITNQIPISEALVVGTLAEFQAAGITLPTADYPGLGEAGFMIRSHRTEAHTWILLLGNTGPAVLTGVFHFLRLLQTHQDIHNIDLMSTPKIRQRILAHWDNLDGSIERGYAGQSLWNWDELPERIDARYHDYARACASIGLNGTVLNNVNADAKSLSAAYLRKTAALADVFRPYGMRVYLSARFSAPIQLGGLATSDPHNPSVASWWKSKVDEIYRLIPDFGGFQVKANSEGQPGPQEYGANHTDGANLLAEALQPHGGILLWRAFVYDTTIDADRAKCAYKEFAPLDGKFLSNVFVQVKNGPIDFQPREPFQPLFGAMPQTPLALELQITQEYLGQSTHLVYLAGMWQEILASDTHCKGPGVTVAQIVDGSAYGQANSCILGVANTGTDRNWCGHHFAQANSYTFGRLAWNHELTPEAIAVEWIRMTWSTALPTVEALKTMLLNSWSACVNYMTPLGLHHIMQEGHHYGPDPAFDAAERKDWNCVYYHHADSIGLGFDRSHSGSDAVSQYHSPLSEQFNNLNTCPEKFLLWFQHVPWSHRLQSGRTLWEELQYCYQDGVGFVEKMQNIWKQIQTGIDPVRHAHVSQRLEQQVENARQWREVCLDYFGHFVDQDKT
jgi:alpha-glucuronidase